MDEIAEHKGSEEPCCVSDAEGVKRERPELIGDIVDPSVEVEERACSGQRASQREGHSMGRGRGERHAVAEDVISSARLRRRVRVSAENEASDDCAKRAQDQDCGAYDEQQYRVRRHIGAGVARDCREFRRQRGGRTGLAGDVKAKVEGQNQCCGVEQQGEGEERAARKR
eukprot:6192010-Pleurochrysis_carterae.AAC.5